MIFYFSGTGNTRWAAKTVAEACGEQLVDITKLPAEGFCHTLADGERLGFCFPIHGWQPPRIVRRFLSTLQVTNAEGHYCFALCTCGDNIGEAMRILSADLGKRGMELHSAFSVLMPDTYVCLPTMDVDGPDEMASKLRRAKEVVADVAVAIGERRKGLMLVEKGPVPMILTYVIGAYFNCHMISDKPFVVDTDRCTHCGRCVASCPTDNMLLSGDGTPQWLHSGQCTCCLSCYHHCHVHAINYGRATKRKGQYYHSSHGNI